MAMQLHDLLSAMFLQGSYNATVVTCGTTSLGAAGGVVGTFALLRKRALVADALAHASLPGICLAFLASVAWGGEQKHFLVLLLGALISGTIGILSVQAISRWTRLPEDAAIGIVLSTFFGFGIFLLSIIQYLGTGEEAGLTHFIYGQTASMRRSDALLTFYSTLAVIVACVALQKEFRLLCFNPDYGKTLGWPITVLDLLLMGLVVVVTMVGLQSVGLLLIVSMLIIPAAAARFWTERLTRMLGTAAFFGAASGYSGSIMSTLHPQLPAGAVIVLCSGVLFAFSFLFAPSRGLIAASVRKVLLRLRVLEDHLLRELYERSENVLRPPSEGLMETQGERDLHLDLKTFHTTRQLSGTIKLLLILRLSVRGFLTLQRSHHLVTPHGMERARELVRNHRLWEEYLLTYASYDLGHVDLMADKAEHALNPALVAKLVEALRSKGQLPHDAEYPQSRHPVGSDIL